MVLNLTVSGEVCSGFMWVGRALSGRVGRHREYSVSSLCPLLVWVGGYTSAFVRRLPCPAQHSCCSPTTFYTRNVCLFLPAVTFGAVRSTGCRMMQTLRGGGFSSCGHWYMRQEMWHPGKGYCPGKLTFRERWLPRKGDFPGKGKGYCENFIANSKFEQKIGSMFFFLFYAEFCWASQVWGAWGRVS